MMNTIDNYDNLEMNYELPKGSDFLLEDDGIGVVEILLILVVLISLVIIFREQLQTLVANIFASINSKSESIYS